MPLELIGDDVHLCCIQQEICVFGFQTFFFSLLFYADALLDPPAL